MARQPLDNVLRHLKRLLAATADEWTDRHLLGRYANYRDEEAFASFVRRHGALVLGVGRRFFRPKMPRTYSRRRFLSWPARHPRVAGKNPLRAGFTAWRTSGQADQSPDCPSSAVSVRRGCSTQRIARSADARGLEAVLDQELSRLADRFREPLLLCYLEGKTRDQAARQLRGRCEP